jgi:hypothetical protein
VSVYVVGGCKREYREYECMRYGGWSRWSVVGGCMWMYM